MPDEPTMKASADGPYLARGPLRVVDPEGNELHFPPGRSVALCRCGASDTKPLCDGTHKTIGFSASGPARDDARERYSAS